MKVERYIEEYARAKLRTIKNNDLMQDIFKLEKTEKINRAIAARSRGIITAEETIRKILEA